MSPQILKYAIGIDCSKKELVCCCSALYSDMSASDLSLKTWGNTPTGFAHLVKWISKVALENAPVVFIVEATGVYHEHLAYYLDQKGYHISVVLPNKIKNFRKSLDIKTDNDRSASIGIAHFGLSRKLDRWLQPSPVLRKLRGLTRERNQVIDYRTVACNELHALIHSHEPDKTSVKRLKERIKLGNKQEKEIAKEITATVKSYKELADKIEKLCTIKGVALLTAVTIVAEADGFTLIRNKKQLVSYAGLDIVEKQSGTSVRGRSKISKRGNTHIRKALYFPAMTAIKHNPNFKDQYARIVSKSGIRMKGQVAIQRKLLVLIYTLWTKDQVFDPNFEKPLNKSGQSSLTDPNGLVQDRPIEQIYQNT